MKIISHDLIHNLIHDLIHDLSHDLSHDLMHDLIYDLIHDLIHDSSFDCKPNPFLCANIKQELMVLGIYITLGTGWMGMYNFHELNHHYI